MRLPELLNLKKNFMTPDQIKNVTTPRVTGIGGIFFYSKNPKETNEWYGKNLGLAIDEWAHRLNSEMRTDPKRSIILDGHLSMKILFILNHLIRNSRSITG